MSAQLSTASSGLPFMLKEDLRLLARRADHLRLESGCTIVERGSDPVGIYILEEGELIVLKDGVQIGSLHPGSVFGEMSLIMEQSTTASVVTTSPSRVAFISQIKLRRLLETYPSLASRYYHSLARVLADRLKQASTELARGGEPQVP